MRSILLLLLALPVLAGCFMPASIQNRHNDREAARQRAAVAEAWGGVDRRLAAQGWRPVGDFMQGLLQETYNESDDRAVTLPEAGSYMVLGMCDRNCVDMDLVLMNAQRRRVTADVEPDATPVVSFQGRAGERFAVRVTIPDCRSREERWSCAYSLRTYRR